MLPARALALFLALGSGTTVLRSVTWIDVRGADAEAARHPGTSVVWRGDEILALGPDAEIAVPEGALVLDGSGKFLIPGLIDMHVHLAGTGDGTFSALVAEGVTGARDLGGDLLALDAVRARIERGELVGPRLARAGFVLEDARWFRLVLADSKRANDPDAALFERTRLPIATAEDALAAVERVVESGADLLKIRNSPPPDAMRTLLREAALAGLRVAAHEPSSIDLLEAAELGLGSLEHLPIHAMLDETTPERWGTIAAALREHHVSVTPTFVAMQGRRLDADELARAVDALVASREGRALTPELRAHWQEQLSERRREQSTLDWKDLGARGDAVLRMLHEAGVPFLAGTDLGVTLVRPGAGLHAELVALVERAGLSPLEALRAATLDAADWLGRTDLGRLRAGGRADLVLLEADPLLAIDNVARVHTVVSRGVVLGPERRAALLAPLPHATAR